MGVDVSYRIKVINANQESEISISEQDNSLNSLINGSGVTYTNFKIELSEILTENEMSLLKFEEDEEDEMLMYSPIMPAEQLKIIIDKIYLKTHIPSILVLSNDIFNLSKNTGGFANENSEKEIFSILREYTNFYTTINRLKAIIDLATLQNANVQIFKNYY